MIRMFAGNDIMAYILFTSERDTHGIMESWRPSSCPIQAVPPKRKLGPNELDFIKVLMDSNVKNTNFQYLELELTIFEENGKRRRVYGTP
ncbi:hypothetical protein FRC18_009162 [Serendipita sp. 400]|nr:hypothetical protein FRC18_009162 [Serendipita sp. 400]